MGALSVVRGVIGGVDQAVGNQQGSTDMQALNEKARQDQLAVQRSKILPYGLAVKNLQQKLQSIDPKANPTDYNATVDDLQRNIHAMREILHPDVNLPAGEWLKTHMTDRLHITNHDQRLRDLQAKQAAGVTQDQATAQGVAGQDTNPYRVQAGQMAGAGFSPQDIDAAQRVKAGITPKDTTETERFVTQYRQDHPGATQEDALKAYTADTTKEPAKPAAPLESGGVMYGVRGSDGKEYYASQMNDPSTPDEVKQIYSTVKKAQADKQAEADKKEEETNERFLKSQENIANRLGQSEAFQARMADFREQDGVYKGLDTQARKTQELADTYNAQYAQPGNKSATDTALLTDYTSVLAAGGRKTQAEIALARNIGNFELNSAQKWKKLTTGELPDELRKMYLDYITSAAKTQRVDADQVKPDLPEVAVPQGPKTKALKSQQSDPVTNFLKNFPTAPAH